MSDHFFHNSYGFHQISPKIVYIIVLREGVLLFQILREVIATVTEDK